MRLGANLCVSRTEADARAWIHPHASGALSARSLCMPTLNGFGASHSKYLEKAGVTALFGVCLSLQ